MKFRKLGESDLEISRVSLGTWHTFEDEKDNSTQKRIQIAFENGINFFDTADVYGYGAAERMLGCALKNLPQDEFIVATKCGLPISESLEDRGLSRQHIFASVDRSLRNLQIERIDLMQCHRFDSETPLEETIEAFEMLIKQGKIRHWGFSKWNAKQIDTAMEISKNLHLHSPVSDQHNYNLLFREIEQDIIPHCQKHHIGIIVYSPLAQGTLTGKYSSEIPIASRAANEESRKTMWNLDKNSIDKVERLREISNALEITLAQLALSWCLHQDGIDSVLTGASTAEQISENTKAAEIFLDDDTLKAITSATGDSNETR
jgi:aryl-alcohol dehydrogenase-like predicted oxidoreductase